jgi:chemotaxis protein methyltransferase CheR
VYTGLEVQRGLPAQLLVKFFQQLEPEKWQVDQSLKNKSKFYEFNLLTDAFPLEKFHVIFCRNILIYQDKENKTKILNNLYKALKVGGVLVLGSGESLVGLDTPLQNCLYDEFTAYKKN